MPPICTPNTQIPSGIYPMMYSFFEDNGKLRYPMLDLQIDIALEHQATGIAILGLATEVNMLTKDEQISLVKNAVNRIADRCPLLVTVTGENADEQIYYGKKFMDLGAHALILQPPTMIDNAEHLFEQISHTISQLTSPIGIQHAPEFLGHGLTGKQIIHLAQTYPHFVLTKLESTAVELASIAQNLDDSTQLFNGRCGLELTDNLRGGASGIIPSIELIDRTTRTFSFYQNGQHEEAETIYRSILPMISFMMQGIPHFLTYGKLLASLRMNISPGGTRGKIKPPTEFGFEITKRFADELGMLNIS